MGKYVSGVDKLRATLKRIPQDVRKEIKEAIVKSAEDVVSAQKRLAPKKTGKLAGSITYSTGDQNVPAYAALKGERRGDPEMTAIISAGNTRVRYAHLVEFGSAPHVQGGLFKGAEPEVIHPGAQPQPFFYPGYRLTKKRAKSRISRAVGKAARKAAKG